MDRRMTYFFRVAQELNISKVAKEFFISQQGLSFQIRSLEKEYGVELFKRSPRLSLTVAGETLLRSVQKIRMLEGKLKTELNEIALENKGLIRVGITSSRSTITLPEAISTYWGKWPHVLVDLIDGVTSFFEKELLEERIDCFIGVEPSNRFEFNVVPLFSESFYIAISDKLLREYFIEEYPQCIEAFLKGVDLVKFKNLPIIIPAKSSRFYAPLRLHLNKNNFTLDSRLTSNNGLLRFEMAAKGWGAAIATRSRKSTVDMLNRMSDKNSHLYVFPIRDMESESKLSLVYSKLIFHPKHIKAFIDTVISVYQKDFPVNLADS